MLDETTEAEDRVLHVLELTKDIINYGDEMTYDELLSVLDEVRRDIDSQIANIKLLAHHTHKFDEDDYCKLCGWDGRS